MTAFFLRPDWLKWWALKFGQRMPCPECYDVLLSSSAQASTMPERHGPLARHTSPFGCNVAAPTLDTHRFASSYRLSVQSTRASRTTSSNGLCVTQTTQGYAGSATPTEGILSGCSFSPTSISSPLPNGVSKAGPKGRRTPISTDRWVQASLVNTCWKSLVYWS